MKFLCFIPLIYMTACAAFTPVMDDVEKMVDNDAVTVKVDKDAFQKDSNVHVNVDVVNHEEEAQKP